MPLTAGDRLGPYTIVAPLGEGGMGAVYRARDPRLGRDVAIKVLRADRLSDPDHKQRFVQEAKAASALNHPNIVTVYDIGTEGDVVYLVMELVDGQPLDRLIPASGFRVPELLRIGVQVADACARAHAAGIVHRDLKPANVMLSSDGRAKVLDFGLAKLVEPETPDAGATRAAHTAEGMIVGTAAYMSPEQAEGRPLDVRSDIFSLGAMLYELSTGQQAFQGDTTMSVIASVLRQEPRPMGESRADLPPELTRLIMRCLRKDPARRVQSMADLMVALQELREEYESGTLETKAPAAPVGRATSGGLWKGVVAAAGVVAAFVAWRTVANRPVVDEALRAVPLTTYPGNENSPSFSPDGNQVAFIWNGEDRANQDIYVKLIGPGPPLRLTTDPRPDFAASWSPDGRSIAFFRSLESGEVALLLVSPLGGPERKVAQFYTRQMFLLPIASLTWTPDSKGFVLSASQTPTGPNRLLHLSVESGDVTPIGPMPASVAEGYTGVALSPDGHSLAAVLLHGTRILEVFSVSNNFELSAARSLPSAGDVGQARWTADSRDLVFSLAVNNPAPLYRMSLAGGNPYVLPWAGAGALNAAIAPKGDRMVFTRDSRDTNIWRVLLDPRPGEVRTLDQIAVSSFRDVAPRYSPDGKRLAFHSNRSGSVQVWTSDADGSRAVQLTSMDPLATTGTARWSPDGQRVAFDSNATGTYQIYVISADGGQPHALTSGVSNNFVSAWSHDARWIYFSSNRGGANQVWKAPSGGGDAVPVTTQGGQAPDVSPDGKWLYFTKDDGARGVWRVSIDGGEEARIVEAAHRNNFAATANGVYFVPPAGPDRSSSVQYLDFATGAIRQIVKIDKPVDLGLAVSPDGRYLLFTQMDYLGQDLMLVEHFR